ncbi:hypothetical protein ACFKHW_04260 [Bradyrhizobium lupini]|uniref:hypothetical protein n=1 Tax=Rhizobium lupini TaxID=136996 RepID=UPI00366D0E6B
MHRSEHETGIPETFFRTGVKALKMKGHMAWQHFKKSSGAAGQLFHLAIEGIEVGRVGFNPEHVSAISRKL